MTDLTGKIAAITGGSRGIGRGIAEALLDAGAKVTINGRTQAKGEEAIKEMNAGGAAVFFKGDVTDQRSIESFIEQTVNHFGRIDILVNNAGGSSGFAPVAEISESAWQEAAAWILHSAFWATRKALPDMVSREWGRIINIGSVEGKQAHKENVSHYITFKHALNGFTKAVAFEYGKRGITSNAICPGAVETDLMKEAGPAAAESVGISYDQFKSNYAAEASIKRLNTIEEIAALAVFLCGNAGSGITGAILPVDGGTAL